MCLSGEVNNKRTNAKQKPAFQHLSIFNPEQGGQATIA
jgi:hypothetical protein